MGLASSRPVGVPSGAAHDLAAGRIRRVLGVADGAQRGGVEDRAVVEVQQENRRLGGDGVELGDGRQPLFSELVLAEAADHAHPLRRRCDGDLALQHAHGIGEAAHAVPAQLHVEVEPAADDVEMVVDQPRQDAPALEVDDLGLRTCQRHHLACRRRRRGSGRRGSRRRSRSAASARAS